MPEHRDLSAAVPDHPVWLVRVDGHAGLANAAAMAAAGVARDAVAPGGGEILRDAAGAPTGVFVDRAMALVTHALPDALPEVVRRRLLRAQQECLRHGLTCVHDAGVSPDTVAAMRELDGSGKWQLRSYLMWSSAHTKEIAQGPWQSQDGLLQLRAVKGYADGALGSYGALLLAPYADRPSFKGLPMTAGLGELAQLCADHGMQLCVHAIGDAANRAVLDAYAATRCPHGRDAARFRIEHCQVIAPDDFARFKELAVVPSMQPTHLTSDMPWAPARLGQERIKGAYAWRSFHELGLPVAFGSDFPVESVDPRKGIYAAVTTRPAPGAPPLRPDQQLTRERALQGFTQDAAFAMFAERELGTIAPGMRADLTVFDRDLRLCPEDELLTARVLLTVVDGRIAFAAD
jgi:predicted amidohydrolase YtcJ